MANRRNFFYRQKVQEDELDAAFEGLEVAERALASDFGYFGITFGLQLVENTPTPNLTVRILGPGACCDQLGQRVAIGSTQALSVAVDSSSVTTAVATPGNEKIVSVFIKFKRALSDPRIDGNSATVYFVSDESFEFLVVQGPEGPHPATPPALLPDAVLLGDITRTNGQTAIVNANISAGAASRRQDQFVVSGVAIGEIREGTILDAFQALATLIDSFVGAASSISYGGGGAWADGTTNPATTVEAQLDKIITDLATGSGAAKIRAPAASDTPDSLSAGRLDLQLAALLGFVNDRLPLVGGTMAGNILADTSGRDLGSITARWDAFLQACIVYGTLTPSATGGALGTSGFRWDAMLRNAELSGNLDVAGATTVEALSAGGNITVEAASEFLYDSAHNYYHSISGAEAIWEPTATSLVMTVSARDPETIDTAGPSLGKFSTEEVGVIWPVHLPNGANIIAASFFGSFTNNSGAVRASMFRKGKSFASVSESLKDSTPYDVLTNGSSVERPLTLDSPTSNIRIVDNHNYVYYMWIGTGGDFSDIWSVNAIVIQYQLSKVTS